MTRLTNCYEQYLYQRYLPEGSWQEVHELWENSIYGIRAMNALGRWIMKAAGRKAWDAYKGDCIGNSYFDTFAVMSGWLLTDWIWPGKALI